MNVKKIFLGAGAAFASAASLVSCGGGNGQVALTFGRLYDASLDGASAKVENHLWNINHDELASLVDREGNFALLIYDSTNTCVCWSIFGETIRRYLSASDVLMYGIQSDEFNGGHETYGLNVVSDEETIAIFADGAVRFQKTTSGSSDEWTGYDSFSSWMRERVHRSDMLYVSASQLEGLFKGADSFVVGFLRNSCPDCSYLSDHFLKTYNALDRNVSYVIECDAVGIRYDEDGNYDKTLWQSFKDRYGLSEQGNAIFGYGPGYVPAFYEYGPGDEAASAIMDGDVYVNDFLTEKENGDYYVSQTFFTEERVAALPFLTDDSSVATKVLLGLEVPSSDVEHGAWKHEAAAEYHDPLIRAFLDYYLDPNAK